jgi:hypothetical protein
VHKLHRAWHYGLNYYLRRDIPQWSRENDTDYIVTSEAGLADLREQGVSVEPMHAPISPKAIVVIRVRWQ